MRKVLVLFFMLAAVVAVAAGQEVSDSSAVGKCGGLFSVSPLPTGLQSP